MNELDQLTPLGVSLAAGLLVGVERGCREHETEEGRLIGLSGGVVGIVGNQSQRGELILPIALIAIPLLLADIAEILWTWLV